MTFPASYQTRTLEHVKRSVLKRELRRLVRHRRLPFTVPELEERADLAQDAGCAPSTVVVTEDGPQASHEALLKRVPARYRLGDYGPKRYEQEDA